MDNLKIGIIGLGHVGAHVLYTLALQGLGNDFVLVDLEDNLRKVQSERQDVLDSTEFLPHPVKIETGSIEDLADRDIREPIRDSLRWSSISKPYTLMRIASKKAVSKAYS